MNMHARSTFALGLAGMALTVTACSGSGADSPKKSADYTYATAMSSAISAASPKIVAINNQVIAAARTNNESGMIIYTVRVSAEFKRLLKISQANPAHDDANESSRVDTVLGMCRDAYSATALAVQRQDYVGVNQASAQISNCADMIGTVKKIIHKIIARGH